MFRNSGRMQGGLRFINDHDRAWIEIPVAEQRVEDRDLLDPFGRHTDRKPLATRNELPAARRLIIFNHAPKQFFET